MNQSWMQHKRPVMEIVSRNIVHLGDLNVEMAIVQQDFVQVVRAVEVSLVCFNRLNCDYEDEELMFWRTGHNSEW